MANRLIMKFLPGVPYVHTKPALGFQRNVIGYKPSPVSLESIDGQLVACHFAEQVRPGEIRPSSARLCSTRRSTSPTAAAARAAADLSDALSSGAFPRSRYGSL